VRLLRTVHGRVTELVEAAVALVDRNFALALDGLGEEVAPRGDRAVDHGLRHAVVLHVEEAGCRARIVNLARDSAGAIRVAGARIREVDDGNAGALRHASPPGRFGHGGAPTIARWPRRRSGDFLRPAATGSMRRRGLPDSGKPGKIALPLIHPM